VTVRCEHGSLPVPDSGLLDVGDDEGGQRYKKQLSLLQHFGLRPNSNMLEIGCGLGGLAYELASFLDLDGRYTGVDISPEAVTWLRANYAPRLRGFRFDLLDVHNPRYRPSDGIEPELVRFPYPDASFDSVCAFEVFMHVPLAGVRNYLREVRRVLRAGGVAILTFQAIWECEEEPTLFGRPFVHIGGGVHTRYPEEPGMSMAYRVGLLRELIDVTDLELIAEIEGLWHSPWDPRPPGAPIHNCDVFGVRRPS